MIVDKQDWDDLSNYRNSLEHYGVLGMKWGVRKDRTSTGSSKKASSETKKGSSEKIKKEKVRVAKKEAAAKKKAEKEAAKAEERRKKILSNPTSLYKHRKEFTYDEIKKAMETFEWEKKLSEYSKADLKRGADTIQTMVSYANNAVNLYNVAARIANSVAEKDGKNVVPYIGAGDASKNKKKGQKDRSE